MREKREGKSLPRLLISPQGSGAASQNLNGMIQHSAEVAPCYLVSFSSDWAGLPSSPHFPRVWATSRHQSFKLFLWLLLGDAGLHCSLVTPETTALHVYVQGVEKTKAEPAPQS